MLQSEPVKKLQAFADNNQVTTGKFTIGDEKVSDLCLVFEENSPDSSQLHNVFMRVDVSPATHSL